MEYQPNLNEKYTTLLHCILSFEGIYILLIKIHILDIYSTSSFISYCFTIAFILRDIILHNFLKHQSSLPSQKNSDILLLHSGIIVVLSKK